VHREKRSRPDTEKQATVDGCVLSTDRIDNNVGLDQAVHTIKGPETHPFGPSRIKASTIGSNLAEHGNVPMISVNRMVPRARDDPAGLPFICLSS
jgi:hypothetical protein